MSGYSILNLISGRAGFIMRGGVLLGLILIVAATTNGLLPLIAVDAATPMRGATPAKGTTRRGDDKRSADKIVGKTSSTRRDPFRKPGLFDDIQKSRRVSFQSDSLGIEKERFVEQFGSGIKTVYTIHPELQRTMKAFFKENRVPYAVFVAMNPSNGKILAMVEHSALEPGAKHLALRATYPAASIFKLITASAAMEEKGLTPSTLIVNYDRYDPIQTTLEKAFATSNNEVFGEIALRYLNIGTLVKYASRFQFNQRIPFEMPVQISRIHVKPQQEDSRKNNHELAKLAAGFGDVGLSPLHAALIGSAIANDGRMMTPCLVERVLGPTGKILFECEPKVFAQAISSKTAAQLRQMMGYTVQKGTARKAFRSARRDPSMRLVAVGGKTGSLTGENPRGKVSWFVGMAPIDHPEIVVSTVVVNHISKRWLVKASHVAKKGFQTYYRTKSPTRLAQR